MRHSAAFGEALRDYWIGQSRAQRYLTRIGFLLIAASVFHIGVWAILGGTSEGPVSWRKPISFAAGIGFVALVLAWVARWFPMCDRLGRWTLSLLGTTGALEVALIIMQKWRGTASHFNFFTGPFNAAVAGSIAVLTTPVMVVIILFAVWSYTRLSADVSPSLARSIRYGMTMMAIGTVHGLTMIANAIFTFVSGSGKAPQIFGAAGVMKVPHLLSLHAVHLMLVLYAVLHFTNRTEEDRLRIVTLAAFGYTGVWVVNALQTYSGLAPFDLDLGRGAVLVLAFGALMGAFLAALVGGAWRKVLSWHS